MESLARCNRPAEAAALQKEVLQNRQMAAERLEKDRLKAFEQKVCIMGVLLGIQTTAFPL